MSFSITCTTCNCRLRVRDDSFIGQILACPKCDSMVMVEPPADYVAGDSGESDSSAFDNQETVDDLDSPLHRQRQAQAVPAEAEPAAGSKADRVFRPVDEQDPMLPTEQWVSPNSQRNRKRLLIAVAGIGGVLLLVIVIALAMRGGDDSVAKEDSPGPPDKGQPTDVGAKGEEGKGVVGEKKQGQDKGDQKQPNDSVQGSDQNKSKGAAENSPQTDVPVKPGVGETGDPSNGTGSPADPVKPQDNDVKPGAEGTKKKSTDSKSPPGLQPETGDPATAKDLTKTLEQFAPFLTNPSFDSTGRSAELRTAPPRIPIPRPTPRRVDVKRRLADRLLGIEYSDVSLGDFLRDITNLSTIPITLDADALLANQVRPSTKVKVNLKNATVGDALTSALEPLQLGYVVDPTGHLLVTWVEQPGKSELTEERYEVDDLVAGDDADRIRLVELLKTLIAPTSWTETIGEGPTLQFDNRTMVVRQHRVQQFRMRVLLDKLRVARGLAPRSGFTKLAALSPRTTQVLPKLSKPASFKFRYATPLSEIVDQIAAAGGLDVMINWQAAAQVGWSPTAESTLVVKDKLVSEAFSNVLDPMDLTLRVVDAGTVEVTTWQAMAGHLDIEAFPVGHVITPQTVTEWMTKLQERLRSNTRRSASSEWAFYYDESSKHLFARLPQIQQIKLAKVLAKR